MKEEYLKRFYPPELKTEEQLENVIEGYHTTSVDNIENILKKGLLPKKGTNSQHETMTRVYFSTNKEGMLYIFNRAKYDIYYKNKEKFKNMDNKELEITLNNNVENLIAQNLLLKIDLKGIKINESQPPLNSLPESNPGNRNTEESIDPSRIKVMIVRNKKTNEISTKFKDIIGYIQGELKNKDLKRFEIFRIKELTEYDSKKLKNNALDTISLQEYIEFLKTKNEIENNKNINSFKQSLRSQVVSSEDIITQEFNTNDSKIKNNNYHLHEI